MAFCLSSVGLCRIQVGKTFRFSLISPRYLYLSFFFVCDIISDMQQGINYKQNSLLSSLTENEGLESSFLCPKGRSDFPGPHDQSWVSKNLLCTFLKNFRKSIMRWINIYWMPKFRYVHIHRVYTKIKIIWTFGPEFKKMWGSLIVAKAVESFRKPKVLPLRGLERHLTSLNSFVSPALRKVYHHILYWVEG